MLIASSPFTSALAPHAANRSWIVFLQCAIENGPIKIEGMRGSVIGPRLRQLCMDSPFELIITGLIATDQPVEHAQIVMQQFAATHLHDGWFASSPDLLIYIQRTASAQLQELMTQVHPGALSEHTVDVEGIAGILGVSERTVRRMVKADEIPYMRLGQALRFEPRNVLAQLRRR